jgi:PAP2 superfamily C-terminal
VGVVSVLIVASRKHYSVDVVIAWYVVPLVFYTMHRRWTTKRPVTEAWPHRPLVGDDDDVDVADLEEVVVSGGALQTEVNTNKRTRTRCLSLRRCHNRSANPGADFVMLERPQPGSALATQALFRVLRPAQRHSRWHL